MVDKGQRVKVIKGRKAVGVTGTVFWIGDNKWGEGKRIGDIGGGGRAARRRQRGGRVIDAGDRVGQ